jgi:hypothetical protein
VVYFKNYQYLSAVLNNAIDHSPSIISELVKSETKKKSELKIDHPENDHTG